jgi:transcriptional regulator with XRE-family HTH domain
MQNIKQKSNALASLPGRLKFAMRNADHNQKDVETETGISQSQISRILKGKFKREGRAVRELEKYAIIYSSTEPMRDQVVVREQLREGICSVWDGTPDDGHRLLRFLEIVKEIRGKPA